MVKLEYKGILKKTIGVQKELYGIFEDRDPEERARGIKTEISI